MVGPRSTEWTRTSPRQWSTKEALAVLDRCGKAPHDSFHLLEVLLLTPGGVVRAAFEHLGFDCEGLAQQVRAQKRPAAPRAVSWLALAREKAKLENFPLATDHFLEVLWDEDSPAGNFLANLVEPGPLEDALNRVRYPDQEGGARSSAPGVPRVPPVLKSG